MHNIILFEQQAAANGTNGLRGKQQPGMIY